MYGTLANILLSCYGVGMEQTFLGRVDTKWDVPVTHEAGEAHAGIIFVFNNFDQIEDLTVYFPSKDCTWQVGDKVAITLRKVSAEVPTDVE